ncbi:MAG: hypothetical protein N2255_06735, partial [Kiritimatiellae bacterium]|nr:hypothetical protein [Kiritimatiellia bacterium]
VVEQLIARLFQHLKREYSGSCTEVVAPHQKPPLPARLLKQGTALKDSNMPLLLPASQISKPGYAQGNSASESAAGTIRMLGNQDD